RGRGFRARGPRPLHRVARPARAGRCGDRPGLLPELQLRAGRLLPDHAVGGLLEPRQVRRHAVRPAGDPRGPPHRRERHEGHPRRTAPGEDSRARRRRSPMTTTDITPVDFAEAIARFDPVLGIEVHVELGTVTKMFDGAPNIFAAEPNTAITPTSLGLPGSLP